MSRTILLPTGFSPWEGQATESGGFSGCTGEQSRPQAPVSTQSLGAQTAVQKEACQLKFNAN